MRVSARAVATTIVVAMPLVVPAVATARASGKRIRPHTIVLHRAKLMSHGHNAFRPSLADLTLFLAGGESSITALSTTLAIQPHEGLSPTASARGPPDAAKNL